MLISRCRAIRLKSIKRISAFFSGKDGSEVKGRLKVRERCRKNGESARISGIRLKTGHSRRGYFYIPGHNLLSTSIKNTANPINESPIKQYGMSMNFYNKLNSRWVYKSIRFS
jgi:hypothetical protein